MLNLYGMVADFLPLVCA